MRKRWNKGERERRGLEKGKRMRNEVKEDFMTEHNATLSPFGLIILVHQSPTVLWR